METIEIRQNKKTLIPMLAMMALIMIGTVYYVYFSGNVEYSIWTALIHGVMSLFLLYFMFISIKKFVRNEPTITMTDRELVLNEQFNPVSFRWENIIHWSIEKDDDSSTPYLAIQTAEGNMSINIAWLDKSAQEIEADMLRFTTKYKYKI